MTLSPKTPLSDAPELCQLSATALTLGVAAGKFSPVEVAKAVIERAEVINPELNAFTMIDGDRAIQAAQSSAERWQRGAPLSAIDGLPATLKDIVWVNGWSVRYGSHTVDPRPCTVDAPSVELLRRSGAVFVGQTTTPEFGWKAVTDNPLHGVTRNPWNPAKTPGGVVWRRCRCRNCWCRRIAFRDRWRRVDPHSLGFHRHRRP